MLNVIKKTLALSFSLALASFAFGADWQAYERELDNAKTERQERVIIERLAKEDDLGADLRTLVENYLRGSESAYGWTADNVKDAIRARGFAESIDVLVDESAKQDVKSLKSSPIYRDDGEKESSNWLSKAFTDFGKWLESLFNRSSENSNSNAPQMPNMSLNWLVPVAWIILGGIVLTFLVLVLRHVNWRRSLARRATAILEEDEPERTLDEWLEQADLLASQGRHREAVRCLYLACLLRFDEHGVARFMRGQTNWEHLDRIETGGRLPAGIEFREPTKAFDVIWYGFHVKGVDDVARFRAWYEELTERLGRKAA